MKNLLCIALLLVTGSALWAQTDVTIPVAGQSVSGQFVIFDRRPGEIPSINRSGNATLLELTPQLLVVSCERIKQALYEELHAGRDWQGKIYVNLRPGGNGTAVPQINLERLAHRWNYRIELPERLKREQFIRTLVQVVLLEIANRTAGERSAEIPLWLSEGLTQRLLSTREVELILPPPALNIRTITLTPVGVEKRDPDPLAAARQILRNHPAATLEELSWPTPAQYSPEQTEVFQASAHLLVAELLQRDHGPDSLLRFVASLARFYNWQTAFLHAYEGQFASQLEFAKWWTLQAAFFVGRDHKQLWTVPETAEQLDQILSASVAVRTRSDELPARATVKLQAVLAEWDTVRQMAFLPDKVRELELARARVAPPFIGLISEYQAVLTEFMKQRQLSTATFGGAHKLPPSIRLVVREAVGKLDELDAQRTALLARELEKSAPPASPIPLDAK